MTTPSDFGLPEKFPSFRNGQLETIIGLSSDCDRFSLLDLPPGAGKSLIYMASAKTQEDDDRTLILVGTKGLQDQLQGDFESIGSVVIKGQANYRCVDPELPPGFKLNCDQGACHNSYMCPLKTRGCLYYDAERIAYAAPIVITNYAYWLSMAKYNNRGKLGRFSLMVLDEAHTASSWLIKTLTIEVDKRQVERYFDLPVSSTDIGIWTDWAKELIPKALELHRKMKADKEHLKDITSLGHILRRLSKESFGKNWVMKDSKQLISFTPVWASSQSEKYLFRGIPKVILSSATPQVKISDHLGIDKLTTHTMKSTFSHKRRPIIFIPTVRVDWKMTDDDTEKWLQRIDEIAITRTQRSGIIHSGSYKRAQQIYDFSKFKSLMLIHNTYTFKDTMREFTTSLRPRILVSPSVEEGYDFPNDCCRWQIVAKIPLIDGRDALTKARKKIDKRYAISVAAIRFIQICGRIVRSDIDWGETFVIDDHWNWFQDCQEFKKWFRRSWRRCAEVPPPMDVLQLN